MRLRELEVLEDIAEGGKVSVALDMLNAHRHLRNAAGRCGRGKWAEAEVDRLIERGTASARQEFLRVLSSERQRHA